MQAQEEQNHKEAQRVAIHDQVSTEIAAAFGIVKSPCGAVAAPVETHKPMSVLSGFVKGMKKLLKRRASDESSAASPVRPAKRRKAAAFDAGKADAYARGLFGGDDEDDEFDEDFDPPRKTLIKARQGSRSSQPSSSHLDLGRKPPIKMPRSPSEELPPTAEPHLPFQQRRKWDQYGNYVGGWPAPMSAGELQAAETAIREFRSSRQNEVPSESVGAERADMGKLFDKEIEIRSAVLEKIGIEKATIGEALFKSTWMETAAELSTQEGLKKKALEFKVKNSGGTGKLNFIRAFYDAETR